MDRLDNKKIVIMGGTTGMGLSAARAFVENGAQVVVVGRHEASVAMAQQELGKRCVAQTGDAILPGTAQKAIDRCMAAFGGFTGLYHVAGGSGRRMGDGPLDELTLEGWNRTLELNLTSLMLSNQAAVRNFLAHKTPGTILNISSVLGFAPSPAFFSTHAYAAAKSAVWGFSRSVASCYAKDNIRVNVLAPSLIDTPMAKRATGDETILSFIRTKQPLDQGRIGQPEDLDGLAVYFMSDQSRFTTGQLVAVDGGWSISDGQIPIE